ncbi:MAG: hypothetical protein H0X33_07800 [Taibaiella sp.]|nr:hypothetical protein [Taibaiella sp.]
MLLQTRLGAYLNNNATAIIINPIIWALMHVPNFAQDYRTAASHLPFLVQSALCRLVFYGAT